MGLRLGDVRVIVIVINVGGGVVGRVVVIALLMQVVGSWWWWWVGSWSLHCQHRWWGGGLLWSLC